MPFRHGANKPEKLDIDKEKNYKQVIQFVIVKAF